MTYIRTLEQRRKASESNKIRMADPKRRKMISNSLKKYFSDPKVKEDLSRRNSGKNNPRYGKSLSLNSRKKLSHKMMGESNHQFKTGKYIGKHHYTKQRDDKNNYLFNNKFKRTIKERDNWICMLCNAHKEKLKNPLQVHHINYDHDLSVPENCVSLCYSCHAKTNANREYWIPFFQSLLSKKYNYQYENQLVKINLEEKEV